MPFAVSQWPYAPDPRSPAFASDGWNFGQVPPFSWKLSTTGATGVFVFFNDGITLRNGFESPSFSSYSPVIPPPSFVVTTLNISGFQAPQAGPPVHTIRFQFDIFVETSLTYEGLLELLFPVAIQVQGPIPMNEIDPSFGTIPNPMELEPLIWSAD